MSSLHHLLHRVLLIDFVIVASFVASFYNRSHRSHRSNLSHRSIASFALFVVSCFTSRFCHSCILCYIVCCIVWRIDFVIFASFVAMFYWLNLSSLHCLLHCFNDRFCHSCVLCYIVLTIDFVIVASFVASFDNLILYRKVLP